MPVTMTSTAVSEGMPPMRSVMPMAMGVVTDLGASDSSVDWLAPNSQPISTADTMAVRLPASRPASTGSSMARTRLNWV